MTDDLISRQKLKDAMYNEAFEKDSDDQKWDSGCWIRYRMFERITDAQPSAQERKTGRWIDAQYPFSKCDQCGAYMDTVNNEANYCCVCGAKMEVEHETD